MHLVDSIVCVEPSNYISALLLSLSTMLQLELPHINVLTKIDLIGQYGPLGTVCSLSFGVLSHVLAFNLDFSSIPKLNACNLYLHSS